MSVSFDGVTGSPCTPRSSRYWEKGTGFGSASADVVVGVPLVAQIDW